MKAKQPPVPNVLGIYTSEANAKKAASFIVDEMRACYKKMAKGNHVDDAAVNLEVETYYEEKGVTGWVTGRCRFGDGERITWTVK